MIKKSRIPYTKKRNLNNCIYQRYNFLIFIIFFFFSILLIRIVILQVGQNKLYTEKLETATSKTIESNSVPRGRIYDRNYKLLVDNVGHKVIYYKKAKGITINEEIDLAYKVSKIIDLPYNYLYKINLKEFWLANNLEEGKKKITEEEYKKYKMRKLSFSDLQKLKLERITDEELSIYTDEDKKAAYLYFLMNNGYSYEEKIIKEDNVSNFEYAYISENVDSYLGFNTKLIWEREYIYGDTIRGILGNVSDSNQGVPLELKDYYLSKGYALNDRVGLNYLEYQYEDLLRGEKSLYRIKNDNSFELIERGMRGHDIVLSIDIDLQLAVEEILIEEMKKAKEEPNTDYYNKSFVIISDPNTGEILVYAAKQIIFKNGEYQIYDYTPYIATTPIVVGSVIKGASMAVGYKTDAINIGTTMLDECIKIKNTPKKCSWRSGLGFLNDIDALVLSSNSYQFKVAMKVGGAKYSYNSPLNIDYNAFDIYRDTYAQFGLGVKTGIDFPLESTGYKGTNMLSGHLLDFAIGQYDTYTSIQLTQYINTIANNGNRIALKFLKEVHEPTMKNSLGILLEESEPVILNKIELESKYLDRIRLGFKEVMKGPLGYNYMGNVPNPAGKTGTSQSFYDSDGDGIIDKETVTKTFAGYYPADKPIMSIVVVSPDISHRYNNSTYDVAVNKQISSKVCNKFLEFYK